MRERPDLVMPAAEMARAAEVSVAGYVEDFPSADDLCEVAWGVIANAYGGNWEDASEEWREAAERWRDGWHRRLDSLTGRGV